MVENRIVLSTSLSAAGPPPLQLHRSCSVTALGSAVQQIHDCWTTFARFSVCKLKLLHTITAYIHYSAHTPLYILIMVIDMPHEKREKKIMVFLSSALLGIKFEGSAEYVVQLELNITRLKRGWLGSPDISLKYSAQALGTIVGRPATHRERHQHSWHRSIWTDAPMMYSGQMIFFCWHKKTTKHWVTQIVNSESWNEPALKSRWCSWIV